MSIEDKIAPEDGRMDGADNGRDARGRWRKGHCPNPKGRPRKKKAPNYDPSDFHHFMNTQVELMVNGKPQLMDRKAAVLSKMFESAMKGRVSQQRYLMGLFEKNEAVLPELRQQYDALVYDWIIDNPNSKSLDESLTGYQRYVLTAMAATLNHYYPGQFEELLPKATNAKPTAEIKDCPPSKQKR